MKALEPEIVEGALAVVDTRAPLEQINLARPPEIVLAEAQRAAVALQGVLSTKPKKVMMNDEQYLEFEDWQTVGHFYGVTAQEDGDAQYVELGPVMGFKASACAVNASGRVLSRATAFCLNDEEKWRARPKYEWHMVLKSGGTAPEESSDKSDWVWEENPKKPGSNRPKRQRVLVGEEAVPLFQLASMAQTRANAKALRNVMAWVVVLAGYRPTPAEELENVESQANTPRAAQPAEPKPAASKPALSSPQITEIWTRAKAQAKATGATDKVIVSDVLSYMNCKSLDEAALYYERFLKLIDGWEPGIDFAAEEKAR